MGELRPWFYWLIIMHSFNYNLAQYIGNLLRSFWEMMIQTFMAAGFFSRPGQLTGKMEEMIRDFAGKKPILDLFRAPSHRRSLGKCWAYPKSCAWQAESDLIWDSIRSLSRWMRIIVQSCYHSILIEEMPEEFEVTASSGRWPVYYGDPTQKPAIYGLQYHPESIGTPMAYLLFRILSRKL